jgi:hypothetical protein
MHPQQTQYERLVVALAELRERARFAMDQARAARRGSREGAQGGAEHSTSLPTEFQDEGTEGAPPR